MGKWDFGISMTVVGMGGTLLTLWFLSVCIMLLKKAFPPSAASRSTEKTAAGGAK
jgi:Na+-transporting methylmalonyl-CoA/oxaloacetate decarboxylase gamma subunit